MKSIKSGDWQEWMSTEGSWGSEAEIEESGTQRAGLVGVGYKAN